MSNPNNSHGVEHDEYPMIINQPLPSDAELNEIVKGEVGKLLGTAGDISAEIRRKAGLIPDLPENPYAAELKAANDAMIRRNKKAA